MAAFSDRSSVKPVRLVSESARERETFEYSASLLSSVRLNETGLPTPASELSTADDVILTGLAQLGALQTGADRSLISLFDAHRQCIVAEATPTQRLCPSIKSDDCEAPLWLCGTAIPRHHGVCELSLLGERPLDVAGGESAKELPLTLSYDLIIDPRFCDKPFCQPGTLARFYAAVPIRTRRGINIGVYCVIRETPNSTWNDGHSQRLRDISCAIMDHLEAQRLKVLHRRDIRMNRGLGSFIEGKSSILDWQQPTTGPPTERGYQTLANSPNFMRSPQQQQQQQQQQRDVPADDLASQLSPTAQLPDPNGTTDPADAFSEHDQRTFSVDDSSEAMLSEAKAMAALTEDESSVLIISKASNLIRESIEVEGCLVFEAPIQPYLSQTHTDMMTNDDECQTSTASSSSSSSEEDDLEIRHRSRATAISRLLGYSTFRASSIDGDTPTSQPRITLTDSFLSKLIRRYPRGQIFNFGADGELQSDSSEDEQPFPPPEPTAAVYSPPLLTSDSRISLISLQDKSQTRSSTRQREGEALLKAFPGARSVCFVPIWDPRKDRWYAGGFIYTKDLARSFSIEQELSYLRAFGMLAMSEILRFKDLRADKAKTDALGSLSHELRSPLHGILLNSELLIDTKLDIFQGNVAHTIETCSRTLLDTVDHLLEYSRISHFSGRDDRAPSLSSNGLELEQFGKKSLLRDSRLDHIVEEVVESVFAGFNFLHLSVKQLSDRQNGSINSDVNANHQSDSLQAIDQLEPWMTNNGELKWSFDDVLIILSMDVRCNWGYVVDVGAIRRIVMNIFGNALKHTKRGTITVSLTQEMVRIRSRKKERVVRFTVQDTGKGIGADFLKHGLFRPFSQEDSLSPGAGLGLSLVKQITTHLQGDISIQSEVGVGTTASVTLPLQQLPLSLGMAPILSDEDRIFKEQVEDLKGLRVRLLMTNSEWRKAVVDICCEWLHMDIIPNTPDSTVTPDLVMWSHMDLKPVQEDFQAFSKTPNVVVCSNALVAYRQSHVFKKAGSAAVFEFISQPAGPRKLARTLHSAYMRWMSNSNSPAAATSAPMVAKRPKGPKRMPSSFSANNMSKPSLSRSASTVSRVDRPAPSSATSATVETPAASADEPKTPPTRILLVDDNFINLKVLSTYITRRNIGFDAAKNGQEAVDLFLSNSDTPYACILMDISMPVMDGFEATRHIRAHETQKGLTPVPIIALSGLTTEDAQQEAFGSGMDMFLTKPVKLGDLGRLLESQGIIHAG